MSEKSKTRSGGAKENRKEQITTESTPDYILTAVLGVLDVVLKPVMVARTVVDAEPEPAMHLFRMLTPKQLGTVIALMEHYVAENKEAAMHEMAARMSERPSRLKRRKKP